MNKLQVSTSMKIQPGKLAEFKQVAAQMLSVTAARDTGTLQYDWFLNGDQTICVIREAYESSEALLAHLAHLDEALGKQPLKLLAYDHKAEAFGDPSPKLLTLTKGLALEYRASPSRAWTRKWKR